MNLLIWFACRNESIKELEPETKEPFADCVWAVRKANLKISRQRALLDPLKENCMDSKEDHSLAFETFWASLKQEPKSALAEWTDFGAFLFVYGGLYLGIFQCWIDPWLQHQPVRGDMNIGLSFWFQCIGVYLILKVLLLLLCSRLRSWKRWVSFMGLFFAYLGILYGSRFIPGEVYIPVWIVVLISGIVALWSVWTGRRYFEIEREKRG